MLIRAETPRDYAAIARVNIRAFDERMAESLVVNNHRYRPAFDPELSLVAEIDGEIVGHALFSPQTIRILGDDVRALNLAPLAVDPAHQKRGIGSELMRHGHEVARAKGYTLSFLLGHTDYYPRFGYRTGVYGVSSLTIETPIPSADANAVQVRRPGEADVPYLCDLWRREENNVDFSIFPGDTLADWLSPGQLITCAVYLRGNDIVGYTRIHIHEPTSPRMFLAADAQAAREIATYIAQNMPQITLPLHPYSTSASAFGAPQATAWDAGMALSLAPNPFDDFYARLQKDERLPGRPIWPAAFDVV